MLGLGILGGFCVALSAYAAVGDASDILSSRRVWGDSILPGPLPTCMDRTAAHRWRVEVDAAGAGVRIVGGITAPRYLALREALLPEVHYQDDGRHAFLLTRTGWVMRLDLERALKVAEVRVGQRVNGAAVSRSIGTQGALLAVANAEPHTLVVLDAQLQLVKWMRVLDKGGKVSSGVAAIHTAPTRSSFIASLTAAPELWEVSYNPSAPEIGLGLVHDFQYREGQFVRGYLNPLRSELPSPVQDFVLGVSGHEVLTAHRVSEAPSAAVRVQITHLDVRKKVGELMLPGWPEWKRTVRWNTKDQDFVAVPVAGQAHWSVIDASRWVLLESSRPEALGMPPSGAAVQSEETCER